ncbi:MAG: M61 family metallopeptidase [Planctomycetes bacterium]|nr:M61 family metallopeptidase [Planctomycetota bacterium]
MSDLPPIRHRLSFPAPWTHDFEVETRLETEGCRSLELAMAVWTPGSYLVREYARHVEGLCAEDERGAPLAVRKTRKNRWRFECAGASAIVVRYRLHARELSVRTNWVDAELALLAPAATFLFDPAHPERPHELRISPYEHWTAVECPLPGLRDGAEFVFHAADYDSLVDAPILAGGLEIHERVVEGRPVKLVQAGDVARWDGAVAADACARIAATQARFWGGLPYEEYRFFNVVLESGGGLEHRDSTVLLSGRAVFAQRREYRRWLGTACHEHFHVWNVKRLRPLELGPFDYENENLTRGLWFAEGATSYYDELLLRRSGLVSVEEYLEELGEFLSRYLATPGRLVQPLAESSYDAWIKLYRPDANASNSRISYYTKGAVLCFLLDAELRTRTADRVTLDDWMRAAYARWSGARGFAEGELEALASELAGVDLSAFFARALHGTEELDLAPALAAFGLRFAPETTPAPAWLGVAARAREGRIVVEEVRRDGPAWCAGVSPEDELLALDGLRLEVADWSVRLESLPVGLPLELLLARRGRIRRVSVVVRPQPQRVRKLELDPAATPEVQARRASWLSELA